jgi:hypothetical protein
MTVKLYNFAKLWYNLTCIARRKEEKYDNSR